MPCGSLITLNVTLHMYVGGPCEHLLCINGGRCVSYNHSEVCICPSGYYGKHCEHGEY